MGNAGKHDFYKDLLATAYFYRGIQVIFLFGLLKFTH